MMGVFGRPDSPYWWLYLETTCARERTNIRIGTTPAHRRDSRKLAEDRYHQRTNQLAAQLYGLPIAPAAQTFDEFADWYETNVAPRHRGVERERGVLAMLRRAFGPRQLRAIDSTAVLTWQQQRLTETAGTRGKYAGSTPRLVSPATVNRETDVLRAVLQAAIPKYLERNPAAGLQRLRVPRRSTEIRVLRPDEEVRLLVALAPLDRAIIVVALDTLARLSDVVWLRRDQDHGAYLVLPNTKTGWHEVPVSRRARQALDALPDGGPYYFAHRLGAVREAHRSHVTAIVRRMFERACRRANVPVGKRHGGVTFHHLRHTGATRMLERGVDVRTVQQIGGWATLDMVQRYTHPTAAALRAAVELIAQTPAPPAGRV